MKCDVTNSVKILLSIEEKKNSRFINYFPLLILFTMSLGVMKRKENSERNNMVN